MNTATSTNPTRSGVGPRELILLAAAGLFRRHGYKGTTVRDIADEVGLLSGSLFHHFRSKEQMLVEIAREAAISMCLGADMRLQAADDPAQRLRILVRFELECFAGSHTRDYFAVLVTEWRDVSDEVRPELQAMRKRYRAIVQGVLRACHDAGLLRPPLGAAESLLHGITTSTISWFSTGGQYTVDEYADIVCRLLLTD